MLERFWKKILRRKRYSLWGLLAFFLWLSSYLYLLLLFLKKFFSKPSVKLSFPVISVGNISMGGTGKTPLVALLAQSLLKRGFKVGIISSGYGRRAKESFVLPGYEMQNKSADVIGDEVKLLAQMLPNAVFSVDSVKTKAAQVLSEKKKVDLIIVDDGFQHFKLVRDIDIVTFNAAVSDKLYKLFPYGILRESLSSIRRADIVILTHSDISENKSDWFKRFRSINERAKYFHAYYKSSELIGLKENKPVNYLRDKRVFLFAGVGSFDNLKQQVTSLGANLDYAWELNDHQRYDSKLLFDIKEMADRYNSDLILTTGKDWVKIGDFDFNRKIYYLNLDVELNPEVDELITYLLEKLKLQKQVL